uniref:Uncharacterized protein n=1 Tax=Piliocolobus tephrosceles TaxID=591936 RepID=A0A8C9HZS6_9PRIM
MWGLSWELLGYWLLPGNISAVSEMVLVKPDDKEDWWLLYNVDVFLHLFFQNLALPCPAPQEVGPMLCITPTPFASGSKLDSANGRHQQKMEGWEERLGSVSPTLSVSGPPGLQLPLGSLPLDSVATIFCHYPLDPKGGNQLPAIANCWVPRHPLLVSLNLSTSL